MVNQLFDKKGTELHVLELLNKKESHVLELLKLMLEAELRFVDLNIVKVVEVFCGETYYLSGSTQEWNLTEGRIFSYNSFVVAFEGHYTVYDIKSNRMDFTESREVLNNLMTA